MTQTQRKNLLKLAAYLESLPRDYKHFDMSWFADHKGSCELPMDEEVYAAKEPAAFLTNCGTVACAVGHGPAAGIGVAPSEFITNGDKLLGVDWHGYSARVFGESGSISYRRFGFLFGGQWEGIDNHHYGAAARIRYYLDLGSTPRDNATNHYAPYRKGSRSAKRREIDAVSA